jgi:DNA-binding MarR family transcriptional regulator
VAKPLHHELKQGRPFELIEEEVNVSIARTAALLDRAFAQVVKPHGITPTQYNVLRILRGSAETGLCRFEIGDRLVTPVPDVTRLLDRMEQLALIVRERSTDDRRVVKTRLTQKGHDLVNALDAELREFHRRRLAHMDPASLTVLVDTLAAIRNPHD